VSGGVDELVVLEGFSGLLVHWFLFPLCARRGLAAWRDLVARNRSAEL